MNRDGVELGILEHVLLDVAEGRVAYAVIARGGVLGIGDRLYAVPWHVVKRDMHAHCFVVDIEPEALDAAPSFDRHHWPAMDADWAERVRSHFEPARGRGVQAQTPA